MSAPGAPPDDNDPNFILGPSMLHILRNLPPQDKLELIIFINT